MTGGGNVASRSALATIVAPPNIGSSDPLAALIVALCPPFQTTVVTSKKKGESSLFSATIGPDVLTQRNSVLRSLCGSGLHHALDQTPLLLLGGHSARSGGGASPASSLAVAGISSWMSVASTVRGGKSDDDVPTLLGQLDGYLASRSFVVPGPKPTLADLDLYLALLSRASPSDGDDEGGGGGGGLGNIVAGGRMVNARRWLEQCGATLEDLVAIASANAEHSGAPLPVIPAGGLAPAPRPSPVFHYGDEDEDDFLDGGGGPVGEAGAATSGGGGPPAAATGGGGGGGGGGAPPPATGGLTDDQKKASAEKRAKKSEDKQANKAKDPQSTKPKKDKGGGGGGGGGATESSEPTVSALDIRVGRIVRAWDHESSEKLYCEEVDVGEAEPRKIASGLRSFYKLEEMQNRTVLVLCNLKARNLGGFPSHGMVLCASDADHASVEFAVPPEGAVVGERVLFDGHDGAPEAENKVAKKKMFEAIAPDLRTDWTGEVVWRGAKGRTSAGVCRAVNGMANAQVS